MKKLPVLISLLVAVSITLAATALAAGNDPLNSSDKSFVQSAYEDGLAEIHFAGLGIEKTANPELKAFAEKLEAEHGKTIGELRTLAQSKNVSVPSSVGFADKSKEMILDAKSGGSFDKSFIDTIVKDHQKAIDSFEKEASDAKDPDVKAYATKTLTALKARLATAQELQQKLGK
ncbi:MAG TPA: DUF4142 domain-containing protein [Chthoniobacter sp.]